ncbi:hypothetical protein SAMN05446037_1006126 [Anaerovirgula multivorans]|uniref:Uncharacterized protein n=1 Tax=Anaerovirgula multivorans TaxID=312168 RepID=A0A239CTL8_9FIRM|nr:hypothetical protein [Anaerovirgula multivorans]SNS23001.1 hypothetical protein SAMN05446037_1006126 [Anaerovirgula multivorans]
MKRQWRVIYYNGVTTCGDKQLKELVQSELEFIHSIELIENYEGAEKCLDTL